MNPKKIGMPSNMEALNDVAVVDPVT